MNNKIWKEKKKTYKDREKNMRKDYNQQSLGTLSLKINKILYETLYTSEGRDEIIKISIPLN